MCLIKIFWSTFVTIFRINRWWKSWGHHLKRDLFFTNRNLLLTSLEKEEICSWMLPKSKEFSTLKIFCRRNCYRILGLGREMKEKRPFSLAIWSISCAMLFWVELKKMIVITMAKREWILLDHCLVIFTEKSSAGLSKKVRESSSGKLTKEDLLIQVQLSSRESSQMTSECHFPLEIGVKTNQGK